MAGAITIVAGCLAATYIFLRVLLQLTQDAREPPAILNGIPFIGPVISMIREKSHFYPRLRDKYRLPIYTLRMPFSRIYVVNATELIPVVDKQWRTISFASIAADAGNLVGMSKDATDMMHKDLGSEEGFSVSWPRYIMPSMSPGADLDDINRKSIQIYVDEMERLRCSKERSTSRINFAEWAREMMVRSTSDAIWGPENPLRDPIVKDAWKTFEFGFLTLSISPLPWLFFPKLYRAREIGAAAMIKYFQNEGYKTASGLVRRRWEHHNGFFNLSPEDCARGELGNAFAVLGNTTATAFWVLYHIFSDEQVLSEIRRELSALVTTTKDEDDSTTTSSIDMATIKQACPIFMSTFQETLRYRAVSTSVRVLLEDVLLDGRYLLKKGNMVMIPAPVQHTETQAWGDDARTFDYLRFARKQESNSKKRLNTRGAFRAFGSGHTLCPGRHFATTEIVSLAALMVLQFDVVPVAGKWVDPTYENSPVQAGFPHIDEDIAVELRPRDSAMKWRVTYSGDTFPGIVAEDIGAD